MVVTNHQEYQVKHLMLRTQKPRETQINVTSPEQTLQLVKNS